MSPADTAGFFTLGVPPERYHLPHPRLGLPVILLIRRVLLRAFELLREQKYNLSEASEDQVTAALRSTIENNLRQSGEVQGFNKRRFETVIRQGQWANYDGTRLTKAPDLFFKLRDDESEPQPVLSEFDGLFIEAKPVDSTHPAGSKYCDDGLIRFVRGDYAWAMQEAMMLAYSRDARTIAGHLVSAMSEATRIDSLDTIQLPEVCLMPAAAACPEAEAVHISLHRRTFRWLDGKGPATDIAVYHLWHQC
ncbi:MAG: hypothetical protein Q7J29_05255 [Stagnimonas sp.]|nr:hypothetical protein [Stagnimonas sp.]